MPNGHTHQPKESRDFCFTGPVAQTENLAAHGGICRIETCACGAIRKTNINSSERERGKWMEPKD